MKQIIFIFIYMFVFLNSSEAAQNSRIKDIATIEGFRENLLVGYGLVIGLNGTGDNLNNSVFTKQALSDFLERVGMNVQGANLKTKNIAAVMVTANLPPFARPGNKLDIQVSTIGDSKSLSGGTLLATPLLGADGAVYAVAQGMVQIPEFTGISLQVKNKGNSNKTNAMVQNGGIVEKEVEFEMRSLTHVKFSLRNPDFSTAISMVQVINNNIPGNTALALDPSTVQVTVPNYRKNDMISFIADIEQLKVDIDSRAKIIIDEATGTIVMGDKVQISPVAISQGNLMISVDPNNLGTPPDSKRGLEIQNLDNSIDIHQLVNGLNKLGVQPRDLINILRNIKAVGALQADIEVK